VQLQPTFYLVTARCNGGRIRVPAYTTGCKHYYRSSYAVFTCASSPPPIFAGGEKSRQADGLPALELWTTPRILALAGVPFSLPAAAADAFTSRRPLLTRAYHISATGFTAIDAIWFGYSLNARCFHSARIRDAFRASTTSGEGIFTVELHAHRCAHHALTSNLGGRVQIPLPCRTCTQHSRSASASVTMRAGTAS